MSTTFHAGTPLFDLLDHLREAAGLLPGELTRENIERLFPGCKLEHPYHLSGGMSQVECIRAMDAVTQYLKPRMVLNLNLDISFVESHPAPPGWGFYRWALSDAVSLEGVIALFAQAAKDQEP